MGPDYRCMSEVRGERFPSGELGGVGCCREQSTGMVFITGRREEEGRGIAKMA